MQKAENSNNMVILITGTRKGIGYYLARYYCKKGFQVIGCSREPAEINSKNYQHFCVDIANETQVKKMFSSIRKTYGMLDILINNAAVNPLISLSLMIPLDVVLKALNINFIGTFLASRESVKLMKKKSFGRIINFGSMAVKHEVKGEAIYTASKAAVSAYSRVFAKEIYSLGITCNVVAPSAVKTDLMAAVDDVALKDVLSRNAINDFGKMEDISNTIDWLIKPESDAITGQVIYLGGT
jgi:3-oxoacyl-[acyl-carrier protein] reductase